MEKERKITAPEGCEIEKIEIVDGAAVVTFREKERKLPKSWEEFCEMFMVSKTACYVDNTSDISTSTVIGKKRSVDRDKNILPDRATADAVLAMCQLIQLRNCYNGEWVPDWSKVAENKYCIDLAYGNIYICTNCVSPLLLYFKSKELRDNFLLNFRPLIEKIKPLYGIKEGGEEC